jgi:hypothetical protein
MSNKLTLEQRISDALKENTTATTAIDLADLIQETTSAIDQTAKAEREKALDPTLSPDPTAARAALNEAEFMCGRLRTLLPRLQQRYADIEAQEYLARWTTDRDPVEVRRDKAARKFERVRSLISEMAAIFTEAEEVDRDVSRINGSAPSGQRHLQQVELIARNLASFSSSDRSIVASTTLLGWDGKAAWPPRKPSIATIMAEPLPYSPRCSADWASARAGADAARPDAVNKEQQRIEAYYREETRLQDERRHREDVADRAAKRRSA